MDVWRAAALPIVILAMAFAACSSPEPDPSPSTSTSPSVPPSRTPSDGAVVSATSSPVLVDRSCADFASQQDAQEFYIEAGGPDQDLHGLDPDANGNACDEQTPAPVSSATVGTTGRATATSPAQPPVGTPNELHSSSGSVEGQSGGSESNSSCESSDETTCR